MSDPDPPHYQPPPRLLDSLTSSQREAAVLLARAGRGIVWWKVGEGKTRVALTWAYYMADPPHPLIICSPGAFRQWEDEIRAVGLEGQLKVEFLSFGRISNGRPPPLKEGVNCAVVDELWLYKNYKSRRSVWMHGLTSLLPAIGLSGSLVTARNIEDLYGQARAVGVSQHVARHITDFRRQFCLTVVNPRGFYEHHPRRGAVEVIQRRLAKYTHLYFPEERREVREVTVNVEPTKAQRELRRTLVNTYYLEHQGKYGFQLEITSAAALLVKLQQISDGVVRDNEGHLLRVESGKFHRLQELCAELLDAGERLLIWTGFRATAALLHEALPFPTLVLSGDHPFDATGWRRGDAQICVATVGSGASLNDFADLRYALFYSTRFSHLQTQQARGRILRKSGSEHARYFYLMQTEGFPDQHVHEMNRSSCSTEEMIMLAMNRILAEVRPRYETPEQEEVPC